MAQKPFRHALVKHYLPGLRYTVLGIILAALVLATAIGCPVKGAEGGQCSAGILLVFVLLLLFLPRGLRHALHTIRHLDMLYYVLAAAVAVAVLFYLPADGVARTAAAILVFIGLVAAKRIVDIRFK